MRGSAASAALQLHLGHARSYHCQTARSPTRSPVPAHPFLLMMGLTCWARAYNALYYPTPQALKDENGRLRGELRNKDDVMALLQEQLASSVGEIDLDSMLKQIDNVQARTAAAAAGRRGTSSVSASPAPAAATNGTPH